MRIPKCSKTMLGVALSCALCASLLHVIWTAALRAHYLRDTAVIYQHRNSVVRLVCERNNLTNSSLALDRRVAAQLYVEHSRRLIYCEVPKAGCSNWKRIILTLNDSLGLTVNELDHGIHRSPLLRKLSSYPRGEQEKLLATYTKVMVTRHPLQRLVAAYRDKFLHDDEEYYSKTIVNLIRKRLRIQSKQNITFQQFAHFVLAEDPKYQDTHWKPMYRLCDPCSVRYHIIGKLETIGRDADFVLKYIGAPKGLRYPSVKHHPEDVRTSNDITRRYLETLPPDLLARLLGFYSIDFSMFEY